MKPKPKDIDVDPRNRRRIRGLIRSQILDAADPLPLDTTTEPMIEQ